MVGTLTDKPPITPKKKNRSKLFGDPSGLCYCQIFYRPPTVIDHLPRPCPSETLYVFQDSVYDYVCFKGNFSVGFHGHRAHNSSWLILILYHTCSLSRGPDLWRQFFHEFLHSNSLVICPDTFHLEVCVKRHLCLNIQQRIIIRMLDTIGFFITFTCTKLTVDGLNMVLTANFPYP